MVLDSSKHTPPAHLALVLEALAKQPDRQPQVVGVFHVLPKQLVLAVPAQARSVLAQAVLHGAVLGGHVLAPRLRIVAAQLMEARVLAKVVGAFLHLLEQLRRTGLADLGLVLPVHA